MAHQKSKDYGHGEELHYIDSKPSGWAKQDQKDYTENRPGKTNQGINQMRKAGWQFARGKRSSWLYFLVR